MDERELFAAAREADVVVALLVPHCDLCKNYAEEFQYVASLYEKLDRERAAIEDGSRTRDNPLTFIQVPDARATPNLTAAFKATNAPFVALLKRKNWYYVTPSGETKIRAPKRYGGALNAKQTVEWLNYALGREPERRVVIPPDVDELTLETVDEYAQDEEYDSVIEFYAKWCGHCKAFKSDYEQIGAHYARERRLNGRRVKVGRLDVDNARPAAARYNISGLPTVMLFKRGHKSRGVTYKGAQRTTKRVIDFIESPDVALSEMKFKDMDPWQCFVWLRDEGLLSFDETIERGVAGESVSSEECNALVHRIIDVAQEQANRQRWYNAMVIMQCMASTPSLKNTPSGNSAPVWNLLDNAKFHVENPSVDEQEERDAEDAKYRKPNGEMDWEAFRSDQAESWRREREKNGLNGNDADAMFDDNEWFDFLSPEEGGARVEIPNDKREEL